LQAKGRRRLITGGGALPAGSPAAANRELRCAKSVSKHMEKKRRRWGIFTRGRRGGERSRDRGPAAGASGGGGAPAVARWRSGGGRRSGAGCRGGLGAPFIARRRKRRRRGEAVAELGGGGINGGGTRWAAVSGERKGSRRLEAARWSALMASGEADGRGEAGEAAPGCGCRRPTRGNGGGRAGGRGWP
jgi:hypothetical protein